MRKPHFHKSLWRSVETLITTFSGFVGFAVGLFRSIFKNCRRPSKTNDCHVIGNALSDMQKHAWRLQNTHVFETPETKT